VVVSLSSFDCPGEDPVNDPGDSLEMNREHERTMATPKTDHASFIDVTSTRPSPVVTGALNFDGTITLAAADVSTSVSSASGSTQRWIYDKSSSSLNTKALAFATPVGGLPLPDGGSESSPRYCGRAMFTDVHAGGGGVSSPASVPASCMGGTMSAEEKALEYLFFDLSGPCFVQPPPHPGF
jgi:hypothetical protein